MSKRVTNLFETKKYDETEDIQLINGALVGDKETLKKLIIRHQQWIYNIAFRMVLDHSDVEDITQEILINI